MVCDLCNYRSQSSILRELERQAMVGIALIRMNEISVDAFL
jgi:hypothetical protein